MDAGDNVLEIGSDEEKDRIKIDNRFDNSSANKNSRSRDSQA